MAKGRIFTEDEARRTAKTVRAFESTPGVIKKTAAIRERRFQTCDPQNAIMQITVLGSPTGGTFDLHLTVGGSKETLQFAFDDNSTEVDTELDTHTEITSGDVVVTAGPFPDATIQIEFKVNLKNTNIALPTANWSSLTGGSGVGVIASLAQLGIA